MDFKGTANLVRLGNNFYSYQTCIAQHIEAGDFYILNRTKYSATTSRHLSKVRLYLSQFGRQLEDSVYVDDVPRGTTNLEDYFNIGFP